MKKDSYGIRRRTSSAVTAGDVEGATRNGRGLSHSNSLAYQSPSRATPKIASIPEGLDRTAKDLAWYKHAFKILFGTVLIVSVGLAGYSLGSRPGVHTHRSLAGVSTDQPHQSMPLVAGAITGIGEPSPDTSTQHPATREMIVYDPKIAAPLGRMVLEDLLKFQFQTLSESVRKFPVQHTLGYLDDWDAQRRKALKGVVDTGDYFTSTIMDHGLGNGSILVAAYETVDYCADLLGDEAAEDATSESDAETRFTKLLPKLGYESALTLYLENRDVQKKVSKALSSGDLGKWASFIALLRESMSHERLGSPDAVGFRVLDVVPDLSAEQTARTATFEVVTTDLEYAKTHAMADASGNPTRKCLIIFDRDVCRAVPKVLVPSQSEDLYAFDAAFVPALTRLQYEKVSSAEQATDLCGDGIKMHFKEFETVYFAKLSPPTEEEKKADEFSREAQMQSFQIL